MDSFTQCAIAKFLSDNGSEELVDKWNADAFCTQRAVDAAKAAEAAAAASRKESVEMALASMHQESSFGGYMDRYNLRP